MGNTTKIYTAEVIRQISDLNNAGFNAVKISEELGLPASSIRFAMKRAGMPLVAQKRTAPNTIHLDEERLCREYVGGDSVLAIARERGISRNVVTRILKKNGVEIRGGRDANLISMAKMTEAERMERVRAAHDAARGSKRSRESLLQRSANIQLSEGVNHGRGELEMRGLLDSHGFELSPQHSVDIYNVDLLVNGTIAMELTAHAVGRYQAEAFAKRREKIREAGYCFVAVHFTDERSMFINAKQMIADLKLLSSSPALLAKEWVIRCRYHAMTGASKKLHEASTVWPSVKPVYSREEIG